MVIIWVVYMFAASLTSNGFVMDEIGHCEIAGNWLIHQLKLKTIAYRTNKMLYPLVI